MDMKKDGDEWRARHAAELTEHKEMSSERVLNCI